jgi:hypothetical protein
MIDVVTKSLTRQFEAALSMLDECLRLCPDDHWDSPIAKYPFWHVAYHTLCYVDVYLSPDNDAWQPLTDVGGSGGLHPKGREELEAEYPSRRFERDELREYLTICRKKLHDIMAAETVATLEGPSGFSHLPFSRMELHFYNLRHIHHHTGQLGAFLRKVGASPGWTKTGWR